MIRNISSIEMLLIVFIALEISKIAFISYLWIH